MWSLPRIVLATALGVVAVSGRAHAGNGGHPRTPVEWDEVTCMEFVDRSVNANYAVDYGIPFEDTDITPEEVENSRTHQFFAICRQTPPEENLPGWITVADVEQALVNYEELVMPPDDDIFERATSWDGCWYRINEDADRRPITDVAAAEPVPWDTSTVPAGVYVLWGYTYEPIFNQWAPRAGGVVRVHDGGEPAAEGPAAAITTREQTACVGDMVPVEGCVDALPGTTMTASFAIVSGADAVDWVPFAADIPVEGDAFRLEWQPPVEAGGAPAMIRVDFTDPNGVTYTAYQFEENIVLPAESSGCGGEIDECVGGFVRDPACESGSDGSGGSSTDASETDAGAAAGDGGCGCRLRGEAPVGIGGSALGLFGLIGLRRRGSRAPSRNGG